MANFNPSWTFSPASGAEILLRLYEEFQPGLKCWNMKWSAKSLGRIKMHGDTNRQNRPIASLVVSPFVGAQSIFGIAFISLQWWWNANETCLWLHISQPERLICIGRRYIFKLADLCFPDSLVLFNLVSMFSYSIWALKLERFSILSLFTRAQRKAGTGHKMQSVPVVFERYIVRDISLTYFWKCSLAHWISEKHEVAFGGTTFTMH